MSDQGNTVTHRISKYDIEIRGIDIGKKLMEKGFNLSMGITSELIDGEDEYEYKQFIPKTKK